MDTQSLDIFAEIAYDCLNEERSQRPNIDEIVTRLEKALELQLEHQNTFRLAAASWAIKADGWRHVGFELKLLILVQDIHTLCWPLGSLWYTSDGTDG
ncbi:hypothetical protein Tco_1296392 [Tanacetum coccineum]